MQLAIHVLKFILSRPNISEGSSDSSNGKESACNAGDLGSIPARGRSPGEENGNPLQYSCQENPMDRGTRWATVPGVAKSWTWLNDWYFTLQHIRILIKYLGFEKGLSYGIKPRTPTLQVDSLPSETPGKPKNTGEGSLSLLQGVFLTQESNWGLMYCRQILYQLSYQRSPNLLMQYSGFWERIKLTVSKLIDNFLWTL